jgi:hypothetical protein
MDLSTWYTNFSLEESIVPRYSTLYILLANGALAAALHGRSPPCQRNFPRSIKQVAKLNLSTRRRTTAPSNMRCTCTAAALRQFVQAITSVHRQTAGPPALRAGFARCQSYVLRPATISSFTTFSRGLGTEGTATLPNGTPSNVKWERPSDADGVRDDTARHRTTTKRSGHRSRRASGAEEFASDGLEGDSQTEASSKYVRRKLRFSETRKGRAEFGANARTGREAQSQPPAARKKESWQIQREALRKKFPEGWNPRKKLSPDALAGIRALNRQFPNEYSTEVLAKRFEVSPEAIRRILRSKWAPTSEEEESRQERWFNRGKQVWERWAALGKKPPRRWRQEGIVRDPIWNESRKRRHALREREDDELQDAAASRRRLADNLV